MAAMSQYSNATQVYPLPFPNPLLALSPNHLLYALQQDAKLRRLEGRAVAPADMQERRRPAEESSVIVLSTKSLHRQSAASICKCGAAQDMKHHVQQLMGTEAAAAAAAAAAAS